MNYRVVKNKRTSGSSVRFVVQQRIEMRQNVVGNVQKSQYSEVSSCKIRESSRINRRDINYHFLCFFFKFSSI